MITESKRRICEQFLWSKDMLFLNIVCRIQLNVEAGEHHSSWVHSGAVKIQIYCFWSIQLGLRRQYCTCGAYLILVCRLVKDGMSGSTRLLYLKEKLQVEMVNKFLVEMFTDLGSFLISSEWCHFISQLLDITFVPWYV